jgi:hypothetical protein
MGDLRGNLELVDFEEAETNVSVLVVKREIS